MSKDYNLTIPVPYSLWEQINRLVPPSDCVYIVIRAFEEEIQRRRMASVDVIESYQQELRSIYTPLSDVSEEIRNMRDERDDQLV